MQLHSHIAGWQGHLAGRQCCPTECPLHRVEINWLTCHHSTLRPSSGFRGIIERKGRAQLFHGPLTGLFLRVGSFRRHGELIKGLTASCRAHDYTRRNRSVTVLPPVDTRGSAPHPGLSKELIQLTLFAIYYIGNLILFVVLPICQACHRVHEILELHRVAAA